MPTVNPATLWAAFAIVCALLVLKAQVLGAATAATRGKLKQFLNAEDAEWLSGQHVKPDFETVDRIARAHRNDLENLLPFFIGGMLFLTGRGPTGAGLAYFIIFLFARYIHSAAYLLRKPALRRNAYTAGWLVTLVLACHAAWSLATAAWA